MKIIILKTPLKEPDHLLLEILRNLFPDVRILLDADAGRNSEEAYCDRM